MATIDKVIDDKLQRLNDKWGNVTFSDFKYGGTKVDFQDLMIKVSENRAVTVEDEVAPLTKRIKHRNSDLDELGTALADLTRQQASFASDAKGSDRADHVNSTTLPTLYKFFGGNVTYITMTNLTKKENEYCIQLVKSKIDGLNNESQTDMTRMQSLVDRRDQSYSTASTLMSSISDSRSALIRNL